MLMLNVTSAISPKNIKRRLKIVIHAEKDDKHKGILGQKCANCHTAKDLKEETFDHNKDTKFDLRGKHQPLKCDACHKASAATLKIATSCISCHKKDDKHDGTLGDRCEKCHIEKNWSTTPGFDHDKTKFPLLDKHEDTNCKACHKVNLDRQATNRLYLLQER